MIFPDVSRRPWRNMDLMLCGLLAVVDGLVMLISLGELQSNVEMIYIVYRTERMTERLEREREP